MTCSEQCTGCLSCNNSYPAILIKPVSPAVNPCPAWSSVMTLTPVACQCRTKSADVVTEAHVSLLLNSGLFVRDMQESDVYLFSMAGAGPVVKSLLRQRKVRLWAASFSFFAASQGTYGISAVNFFIAWLVVRCCLIEIVASFMSGKSLSVSVPCRIL